MINHDELPQALHHLKPDYDAWAAKGRPSYKLDATLYYRDSTDEWVLEIEGSINGTHFTARHPAPKALSPEDAVGLPHLYLEPLNRDTELQNLCDDLEMKRKRCLEMGALNETSYDGDRLLALQEKQEQHKAKS